MLTVMSAVPNDPWKQAVQYLKGVGPSRAALLERLNIGGSDSLIVPGEYLEVVVTKVGPAVEHG